jgi:tripartite-type tricarboxylate transporter receptor subunit TctC
MTQSQKIRRTLGALSIASLSGALLGLVSPLALAQDYPNKAIRLVVPFAAGGGTDLLARMLAKEMTTSLGQSVVVENVSGAGGSIGAAQVARAPADGYTLMMGTPGTIHINPAMNPNVKYNVERDFIPVAHFSESPSILVVAVDSPFKTVQDVLNAARAKPGELNYGSAGVGSSTHLNTELFMLLANIKMTHIPYRGTAPAITDMRGGRLQLQLENLPAVQSLVKDKQIRAIAVGSPQRSRLMPELPTIAESGVPGYESSSWTGLFAPAGTPAAVVARLEQSVKLAATNAEVITQLSNMGAEPVGSGSAEFRKFLDRNQKLVVRTVEAANMKSN